MRSQVTCYVCLFRQTSFYFLSKNFLMVIFEGERQNVSGRGAEREGDAEPEAGSGLRAVRTEPDAGLELTNGEIMARAEVGRSTD